MLHLLYILAFTVLACIAVANLIRNLIMFSFDREPSNGSKGGFGYYASGHQSIPHPELLDNTGKIIREPLLVMRSINVEDARQQLDAIYESSPSQRRENEG
jgi:hypothetical protein